MGMGAMDNMDNLDMRGGMDFSDMGDMDLGNMPPPGGFDGSGMDFSDMGGMDLSNVDLGRMDFSNMPLDLIQLIETSSNNMVLHLLHAYLAYPI
eukprot:TRINITY_DN23819_c0_g1_i2.p4 TRINITY_DN23819_c0_g1~~TRINITY_DN23819_c0_g1_i2.p4  ORF type:complete len:101 (+),score=23.78 TRINITY_DN23819_c0_g1_i2:22-303(+)